ncbi:MAG: aminotransferase class I/II-fold pyridoxal phosphate-dependent enzyme [Clostridiales bacterium]
MHHVTDKDGLHRETLILGEGAVLCDRRLDTPINPPVYLSTAFCVDTLDELQELHKAQGYSYIRTRNPNRNMLSEMISYLEGGEQSLVFSSGMAAITTAISAHVKAGDHILADDTLYGETMQFIEDVMPSYGVEITMTDFTNIENVKANIRPNTKVVFSEVVTNPTIKVIDVAAVAEIAHSAGACYIVDNTFTTSFVIKPLDLGADIAVNSLTKFANGHSDVCAGAATGNAKAMDRIWQRQKLAGGILDPFSAYLCQRGMRTMDVRLERQCKNAAALAKALESCPYVEKVLHPSLASHPQKATALKQFKGDVCGAMLSFYMPENWQKINEFMTKLRVPHYAMTLGGYRTSLSYPIISSHSGVSKEEREALGITDGLMRISVGMENTEDLVNDFLQALNVFGR